MKQSPARRRSLQLRCMCLGRYAQYEVSMWGNSRRWALYCDFHKQSQLESRLPDSEVGTYELAGWAPGN